jgi:hypothetical protein
MPSEQRDRQFERALQRHLRDGAPDVSCPDAETLAAYHERTLSLEELAHWKEHISGCARCQETLALLEQTNEVATEEWESKELVGQTSLAANAMPPNASSAQVGAEEAQSGLGAGVPAAPIALHRRMKVRSSLRWAVPVGALAAGLLIFVSVREGSMRMTSSMQTTQMAENRQTAAPQPPATMNRVDEAQREERLAEPAQSSADARKKSEGPSVSPPKVAVAPRMPSPNELSGYDAGASEGDKLAEGERLRLRGLESKPDVPRPNAAPVPNRAVNRPAAIVAPPPPPPSSSVTTEVTGQAQLEQAPAASGSAKAKESQDARTMTQSGTVSSYSAALGRSINSLHEVAANNPRVISAPDNQHAWRVGPGGIIEATSDAGVAWKLQKSGVNVDLSGGSAPSETVCWVVGKSGTVLLTTDSGKHWKTLASPFQEDLGGVHAVDAKHAAIWNVGNQKSFETGDGGLTWSATAIE